MKNFLIIVDKREPKKVIEMLSKFNFTIDLQKLEVGDFYIPSTNGETGILVERKDAIDLAKSIKDKRIWNQARRLPKGSMIIIEGSLAKIEQFTGWNPDAVASVITSLRYKFGLDVFFTPSIRWTCIFLRSLARTLQEKKEKKLFRLVPKKIERQASIEEKILFVLESFPNIGPTKAVKIIDKFKSIYNFVNAQRKELENLLGKKTGSEIYDLIHHEVDVLEDSKWW